jgi:hypothetical protein
MAYSSNKRCKRLKVMGSFLKLTMVSVLITTCLASIPYHASSAGVSGGNLDLFTQKTPFGGRGPGQLSDAFQQQELVILYALVTFNGEPIGNKVVAYEVDGPANSFQNITFIGGGVTNGSGIAEFSFRIPTVPFNEEQIVFGKWYAVATVDIDETVATDNLTFEVGWIIRIKNIVTFDSKLSPQTDFARESLIVFDLTLENIALTNKNATITIDVQDVVGHPIISIELDNQTILPGEQHRQTSSKIPTDANIGEANVSAVPLTAPPNTGGIPYSPSVYAEFNIVVAELHDVAVTDVIASPSQVQVGENVGITIETANLGDFPETYDITAYYDSNLIQLTTAISMSPHSSKTISVNWNTANVNPGVYTISANASIVEGDINPANNKFIDGNITVSSASPPLAPYLALLIPLLMGLGILAGLAFLILLMAYYRRRRRRKTRRTPHYVTLVHPHI